MSKSIKVLILTLLILISGKQFKIFAQNVDSNGNTSTELDGQIGEWDPTDLDAPDFGNFDGDNLEGNKPGTGDYYTISVTIPLNMEFLVAPHSALPFGDFISPEYSITNNGSKTVTAKVVSITQGNSSTSVDNAPLYIEKSVAGDNKTQMELNLSILGANLASKKDIALYRLNDTSNPLTEVEKKIGDLNANETKKVTFSSDYWELPKYEVGKDQASSEFVLGLEFSIANP